MFLDTSTTARNQRRNRKRAWLLTSSVALHGLALASFAGAQMWRIEAIGEPPTNDVFQVMLPPPPLEAGAPAPPPTHAAAPRQPEAPRAPRTAPPTLVQPDPAVAPRHLPTPPAADPPVADVLPSTPDPTSSGPSDTGPFTGKGARKDGNGWGDGRDVGDDRALPIGGPISRPQIVPGTKVQPHYTELARQARLQGVVVLEATIDERGNVVDVHVVKGLRMGLDDEAVKAVSQWKFTPALLHGRPVKVYFDLTVQFEVR